MLGFLIAIVAGFLTPQAETAVARPLARAISGKIQIEPGEQRAVAFIVVMLVAGILAAVLASGTPFGLICGGAIGFFATRIITAVRDAFDGKNRS